LPRSSTFQIVTHALGVFCLAAIIPGLSPAGAAVPAVAAADGRLTCFLRGFPQGIKPTDEVTFTSPDVQATIGINRKQGGVGVELTLALPHSEGSVQLLDPRSAGGAGWQTSIGVADDLRNRIIHYNQAAGNSAHNWGFASGYDIDSTHGILQQDWLPLFSNDYREGLGFDAHQVNTSPCTSGSDQLGDGKLAIRPTSSRTGNNGVLSLTNAYTIRAARDQRWHWIQVDQALYMNLDAVRSTNLQVFLAQVDRPLVGPVSPEGDPPERLIRDVRHVSGTASDWFLATQPLKYALLVLHLGGHDLGIAIHTPSGRPFTGFLRSREDLFCHDGRPQCGNLQWHSSTAMSRYDPSVPLSYKAGEETIFAVQYDIGTLPHLAALGFDVPK
jgi:hypothetical protein